MKRIILLVLMAVLAMSPPASALSKKGDMTVVTTKELKAMMDAGEPLVLANTMAPLNYQAAHIPGSVNVPVTRVKQVLPELAADKGARVIFYCMGPK